MLAIFTPIFEVKKILYFCLGKWPELAYSGCGIFADAARSIDVCVVRAFVSFYISSHLLWALLLQVGRDLKKTHQLTTEVKTELFFFRGRHPASTCVVGPPLAEYPFFLLVFHFFADFAQNSEKKYKRGTSSANKKICALVPTAFCEIYLLPFYYTQIFLFCRMLASTRELMCISTTSVFFPVPP